MKELDLALAFQIEGNPKLHGSGLFRSVHLSPPLPTTRKHIHNNRLHQSYLLLPYLSEMGNDGGSIPKRRELVKEAARLQTASEVKESKQEQQEHRWKTCILSQQPLKPPIVSDWLGNLYNKYAILEYLLPSDEPIVEASKADKEKILDGRVKSLKDVVEVKFHEDEEDSREDKNSTTGRWLCPVSNKVLGPSVKAVYLVPCGHAFSETAIKEVATENCLQVMLTQDTTTFVIQSNILFSATKPIRQTT